MMAIFYTPMTCVIYDQKPELHMELCALQCDSELKLSNLKGIDFWKDLKINKYPLLKKTILSLYSMFGSTFICESAFSKLKLIKNKHRSRISNENLEALLKLSTTDVDINIDNLLEGSWRN